MKNLFILLIMTMLFAIKANAQCDINGPSTILEDKEASYTTNTVSGANYFWSSTGDIDIISSNNTPSVEVAAAGDESGQLCVTIFQDGEEPCCNCTDITIETEPECIPATGIQITEIEISGNGCPGDAITFTATVQPSNTTEGTYHWEAGIGFIGSNVFHDDKGGSTTVIQTPPGNYQAIWVRVTFTSCDGSTVSALQPLIWENDCFPNGGKWEVGFSQNPFDNQTQFLVDTEIETEAMINIFNSNGDLVYSKNQAFQSGKNIVDILGIPESEKGLLHYQIKTQNHIVAAGSIIKL